MLTALIAHVGQPAAPHDVIGSWNLPAGLSLLVAAAVYQRGFSTESVGRRFFLGGLTVLAVAIVTPLDAVAGSLASAHMLQHMLIVLVAAPLLALARPLPVLIRAIPLRVQRGLWRRFREVGIVRGRVGRMVPPAAVWLGYVGTLWLWHAAAPYQAAVGNDWIHGLEHGSFLAVGFGFWHVALGLGRHPLGEGTRVLFLFTAAMQGVLLAALLTFGSTPWYPAYAGTTGAFGLDPLTDQQLAGLLLWIPSGLVYTGVSLVVLARWIGEADKQPDAPTRDHAG